MDRLILDFSFGWNGSTGIVAGFDALDAGEQRSLTFAVTAHPGSPDGQGVGLVTIGKARDGSYRFVGDRQDPEGAGSRLLAEGRDEALVQLSMLLGRAAANHILGNGRGQVFRQPDGEQRSETPEFRQERLMDWNGRTVVSLA